MEKIDDIIYSIAYEKNLDLEKVKEAIKASLLLMAKNTINENLQYNVYLDDKTRTISLFKKIFVIEENGQIDNGTVSIEDAKNIDSAIVVGDFLESEIELESLKRSSSNFLFLDIEKRLQQLLEDNLYEKYNKQIGKIISATVLRVDSEENTVVGIEEIKGILSMRNRIKGEVFKVGDTFASILNYVKFSNQGMYLELSRTTPKFLNELLKLEVPELEDNQLEIVNSARIPGIRSKIAVKSYSESIDPIGTIVGVKGVRIKAVSSVLNNENIDCIEYADRPEIYISRALSPALVGSVVVDEENKRATVSIDLEQKKKAIGAKGFNIRLASMLTGYEIVLEEKEEASKAKSELSFENLFSKD